MTALETIRDNIAYPTKVKQAGAARGVHRRAVRAVDQPDDRRRATLTYLDKTYGGDAQVRITVLKPVGKKTAWTWTVVAQSPLVDVQPYLGQVVQFPLTTTIPVVRGETIALTTPTWAPVLSIDLPTSQFAYRQSRSRNCQNPADHHAGSGERRSERRVLVRLPRDAGRVQRNRGHEPGGADHDDDDPDQEVS